MKKLLALILTIFLILNALPAFAEEISFYSDEYPESKAFVSTWVAEDGDWRIEVYDEDGGLKLMIVHVLGDNKLDVWEYSAALSVDGKALETVPLGLHFQQDTVTGNWNVNYYEDGDAAFTLNEAGRLLWDDRKEAAGEGGNINLLILHAEDQLMSAEGFKTIALEFIEVYKRFDAEKEA